MKRWQTEKRVVLAAFALLSSMGFVMSRSSAEAQLSDWYTLGKINNPLAADVVLADTGSLGSGMKTHTVSVMIYATVATTMRMEHRNTANTANVKSQELPLLTNTFLHWRFSFVAGNHQRLRIVTTAAVVGDVQASIFLEPQ